MNYYARAFTMSDFYTMVDLTITLLCKLQKI